LRYPFLLRASGPGKQNALIVGRGQVNPHKLSLRDQREFEQYRLLGVAIDLGSGCWSWLRLP
jgi:hypothetical protein